jgi:hypothetical protein
VVVKALIRKRHGVWGICFFNQIHQDLAQPHEHSLVQAVNFVRKFVPKGCVVEVAGDRPFRHNITKLVWG